MNDFKVGDYVIKYSKYSTISKRGEITKIFEYDHQIFYTVYFYESDTSVDVGMDKITNQWYVMSLELDVERIRDEKLKELGI